VTPSPHRLILWDIDGTLANSGSAATAIFDDAVEHVLGVRPTAIIVFSGKTDRHIAEELLVLTTGTPDDVEPGHIEAVLLHIEGGLARRADAIAADGRRFPGAREAITGLAGFPGVAQTVLTGNVAANARVKLAAFGLDELLDLEAGSYGRDHVERSRLLPVAWERQRALRGRSYSPEETWIVGDTPRDLACARSGGAHCLLVGTGRFSFDELAELGADAVLPDLADTPRVVAILTGDRTTNGGHTGP
jgi:phosphoglycolate phosphatase